MTASFNCNGTALVSTANWLEQWSACTRCSAGQFKKHKGYGNLWSYGRYPVAHNAGCVDIPSVNGYTILPEDEYLVYNNEITGINNSSALTIDNAYMWHRQISFVCNGVQEVWDIVGPFVNWWEKQEICAKLGKTPPGDNNTDPDMWITCTETNRNKAYMLKNTNMVGTDQSLVSAGILGSDAWYPSTGMSRSWMWYCTDKVKQYAWQTWCFGLYSYSTELSRDHQGFWSYVICRPVH